MKTVKITGAQLKALQMLSRKDIAAIRKHPGLVSGAKHLLIACKKTIGKLEGIPEYASRKKRQTAYRRIAALCRNAIAEAERKTR